MPNLTKTALILFISFCLTLPQLVSAHKVSSAEVVLRVYTEDERYFQLEIATAVESSGDAALDDEIGPVDAAQLFVEESLFVLIDEQEQPKKYTAKLVEETDPDTPEELKRLSVLVTWRGKLPLDGKELAVYLHETSELQIVMLTDKNGVIKRRRQIIFAGEYSRAENIEPLVKGNPFEQTEKDKGEAKPSSTTEAPDRPNAFIGGVKACFYNMALALVLLCSTLLISPGTKQWLASAVIVLVFLLVGLLLPEFVSKHKAVTILAGIIILLISVDNILTNQFRVWRYLAAGIGAFCVGTHLSQGPFINFANQTSAPFGFALGTTCCLVMTAMVIGLLLKTFRQSESFKSIVITSCSIVFAGIAVFLLIENL